MKSVSTLAVVAGIIALHAAVLIDRDWLWGVVFFALTVPALRRRRIFFIGEIVRNDTPFLYWLVVGSLIGQSILIVGVSVSQNLLN